jgi:hypothetical protein
MTSIRISLTFRLTCKSDTTNLTQDNTHSQKDSVFKAPRASTVIMGRYPNFADFPCWIRRDSLRRISEYTLNMLVSNKSVIKSYCTVPVGSFKSPCAVGNDGGDRCWCYCSSPWTEKNACHLDRFSCTVSDRNKSCCAATRVSFKSNCTLIAAHFTAVQWPWRMAKRLL